MTEEQQRLSSGQRMGLVLGAVVILVVAFLVLRGGDDDPSPSSSAPAQTTTQATSPEPTTTTEQEQAEPAPARPTVPTIRVVGGEPRGGIRKLTFDKGAQVRFRVVSDTAQEIHVHGYDVSRNVPAGGRVTVAFKGDIDGRFEVELEGPHVQIAELSVVP